MRKVFTALAGGALAIVLLAPATHATAAPMSYHHRYHGIVSGLIDWLL